MAIGIRRRGDCRLNRGNGARVARYPHRHPRPLRDRIQGVGRSGLDHPRRVRGDDLVVVERDRAPECQHRARREGANPRWRVRIGAAGRCDRVAQCLQARLRLHDVSQRACGRRGGTAAEPVAGDDVVDAARQPRAVDPVTEHHVRVALFVLARDEDGRVWRLAEKARHLGPTKLVDPDLHGGAEAVARQRRWVHEIGHRRLLQREILTREGSIAAPQHLARDGLAAADGQQIE